jgi:putative membrane-bound dehydrogenase-like protein
MTKIIILPFFCLFASLSAAPTREAFALEERAITGVPTDAFELGDSNLTIELWARSPMIYSPVAMDFDAQGRLWTTEGIDYQRGRRIAEGRSIIVLEDKDWDGKADTSTIFVTEKEIRHAALGIAVFDNQIVLSSTPSIIVYTDVNRNAVFDEGVDKREVFLTGFRDASHDHTLHAVVGAPSGQWHFSYGNRGADITTKDGRNHISGCYYGYSDGIGKKSSDGEVYVGGMTMRINPDGTGLTPTGENMRNSHDMFVSSYGDIYQSDNDDPAHARISWVMEHANMGYADLTDGSRSWEEVAKSWEEPAGWSKSLRFSRSHWRENYPGAFPPGTIYGAGSPTGNVLIEDHTLGLAGTYLVACMVRKEVMTVTPKWKDAQIEMGDHQPFIRLKNDRKGEFFLPTDLALAPDGSLFLSDFYNDTSRGTNQVSGSIYRITRKDQKPLVLPKVNFSSISGLLQALKNPAVNVRSHAAHLLVKKGK